MDSRQTLYDAAVLLRESRRVSHLYNFCRLALLQRRCLEILHGAWALLRRSPSVIERSDVDGDAIRGLVRETLQFRRMEQLRLVHESLARCGMTTEINFRYHCFTQTDKGFVIGEYAEAAPRLLCFDGGQVRVFRFYDNDADVRHIHAVQWHAGLLYVTTGDAGKYLDLFTLHDGRIHPQRRLRRILGGFTAACSHDGELWFGSDFTGRPNYLLNFQRRSRFYFPDAAFKQFCDVILPLSPQQLLCINRSLTVDVTFSIFDTREQRFVFCCPLGSEHGC
jgi:hypothetical protein